MRKVIDGKIYNTDTADCIGQNYSENLMRNDFNFWWKGLYLTKKGQYFLVVERACTDDKLILFTRERAKSWCEKNDIDIETIQEYFGELEEG